MVEKEEKMSCSRNYGIDFLRLIFMFMICTLHVLGQGGVLNLCAFGTINHRMYWLIEVVSYCAVDGFAFITGYTASDKTQDYSKFINMWFQVFFYSFIISVLATVIGIDGGWNIKSIIMRLLPVTFNQYWYFTAYFALFFFRPILNKYLFNAPKEDCKKIFIFLFVLFSLMGTLKDPFKAQDGFSSIWIIVVYCMGGLAKQIKLFEQKRTFTLLILWLCANLFSWILWVGLGIDILVNYLSPTIFVSGMILVVIFSRVSFNGDIIRKLSPLAFGVYLFQMNPVIWNGVFKDAFKFIYQKPLAVGVGLVFAYSGLIFVIGLVVEYVRARFARIIGIEKLSQRITNAIEKNIIKLFIFLE